MIYLDTSAAFKLVHDEAESVALTDFYVNSPDDALFVSSMLLHTELACAAKRCPGIDSRRASVVSQSLVLFDVVKPDFLRAAEAPWGLRSMDAIHLAVALRVGAEQFLTYDREQADVARMLGFEVVQPGVPSAS